MQYKTLDIILLLLLVLHDYLDYDNVVVDAHERQQYLDRLSLLTTHGRSSFPSLPERVEGSDDDVLIEGMVVVVPSKLGKSWRVKC